eukprot:CAMPEP_0176069866 /NCGR_PEP_ID=MMETSP0120_2-20121206/34886_1 /TAXON_ID=160619 /ORGANISM="Kryptoperidinium foliaceum, Strain CCMP 1326" /LENGTH=552 /DNA_ID=CAMNT_0017403505 /DNA_START=104 /DNA_END=1759 /DNA_ORIENTATION=-
MAAVGIRALAASLLAAHLAAAGTGAVSAVVEVDGPAEPALLQDIAVAMGEAGPAYLTASRAGLPKIEAGLAPILPTLPRDEHGKLEGPAVRYALYHFFVREYGWRIKGLDPVGGAWNSSSPSETPALKRMPASVRELLAKRLDEGLDERDLGVLAWTLRHLVQDETDGRLVSAYELLRLPLDTPIPAARAEAAIDLHMASHVAAVDLDNTTVARMRAIYSQMDQLYPAWNHTVAFIHEAFVSERATSGADASASIGLEDNLRVLSAITERYGLWQDSECKSLKEKLLPLEDQGSGRVHLADFYSASLGGAWQFSESVDYLRRLGALDESAPGSPRVIIVNYLLSYANCVGSTGYNELCCLSECEALMSQVERRVAAASADPEELLEIVAALSSSTVPGGRSLDAVSRQRLRSIAAQHGGGVPIYGRLFAQWMHHAYPRECPYPHVAGATEQLTPVDFARKVGTRRVASAAEMQSVVARPLRKDRPRETVPWDRREEVLAPPPSHVAAPLGFALLHVATALAMCSLLASLWRVTERRRSRTKAVAAAAAPQIP